MRARSADLVIDRPGDVHVRYPSCSRDLLTAGDITGGFASFVLGGLDADYVASGSVFEDGNTEVYRLTLTEVPEPASVALLAAGLLLLALRARRTPARRP